MARRIAGSSRGSATGVPELRSPVSWALLGLVIERPSDGHELAQRFERTYGDSLQLNRASQIHVSLDSLVSKALIKEMPSSMSDPSGTSHPKPRYRATPKGVRGYQDWLIAQASEERRRSRLFALQIAALTPSTALKVIESYELACLEQLHEKPRATLQDTAQDGRDNLAKRLASEEDRLAVGARLTWIEYARRELKALIEERDDGAVNLVI